MFDQISFHHTILCIPYIVVVESNLIVMGLLNFLLKPELLEVLTENDAKIVLYTTTVLVLEGKAHSCDNLLGLKKDIDTKVLGDTFHPSRLMV